MIVNRFRLNELQVSGLGIFYFLSRPWRVSGFSAQWFGPPPKFNTLELTYYYLFVIKLLL